MKISLEALRTNKKLTQEEVAKILGIARNTYIRKEKGEIDLKLHEAFKLAEILDFDVNILK